MKLAYSSTAFDEPLRSGELTQLEWIDLCAHELAADGVVFDVRHFPRTDTDYLAQVKKMAVDLGLGVAALWDRAFFEGGESAMEQSFTVASAIGSPLISAPLPEQTALPWAEMLSRLGSATSLAKRHNITIAVRNAPATFAASVHDMKRVTKEADSAWLRYAPEFARLDAALEPEALLGKAVLLWHQSEEPAAPALELAHSFLGYLSLDRRDGSETAEQAKSALRSWRGALFRVVDRT